MADQRTTESEHDDVGVDLRDGAPTTTFPMLRRVGFLGTDINQLYRLARLHSEPNPFVEPPRGYEAGFHEDDVDVILEALAAGSSVVIEAPHGGGKDRVQDALYSEFHAPDLLEEAFVTNPEPRSFTPAQERATTEWFRFGAALPALGDADPDEVVVSGPWRNGTPAQVAPDCKAQSEESKVVVDLKSAVLSLLSFMEVPSGAASAARDAILGTMVKSRAENALRSAEEILGHLATIAQASDRCLVLRLTDADALKPRQLALLGRILSHVDGMTAPVRLVVSGLPGAVASILNNVPTNAAVTRVELDWQLDTTERTAAVDYFVELTAASDVPFPRAVAERVFDRADGIMSLMNEIGRATWQLGADLQQQIGRSVTEGELLDATNGAAAAVLQVQRQRYEAAIALHDAGDPSARYVRALYVLTKQTGAVLHEHDAVVDTMEALYAPTARFTSAENRESLRRSFLRGVDSTMLRERGFTTRSDDGRIGLADPQLGALIAKFVPHAAHGLL